MKKIVIQILFFSLFSQVLYCQDEQTGFKFDLSVRYRFELWNGMNAKNYGDDSPSSIGNLNDKILLQRVIPGFTYSGKNITASFHLQDSRAFGWSLRENKYPDLFKIRKTGTQSPYYTMNPQEEYFEIYDLYLEYRQLLKNVTVKIGRQKIFYGDYRIFGPGDWGNTGRWTWDAIKISYKRGENFIDVFGGGTKIHDPLKISVPFTQTEFWGGGLYAHYNLLNKVNIEPFFAIKTEGSAGYINEQSISRNWIGIRLLNDDRHNFIYDFLYSRETGKENGKRIDAFGYFAKIGYRFDFLPAKPFLSIRESFSSGGRKSDLTIHTFDPAFGAGDKFYGWMNIVLWTNLNNPEVVLELYPVGKKMWVEMKYNRFYIPAPDDVIILNTMKIKDGSHHLGDETDIFVRYQPFKHWQFTCALGYFIPGQLSPINYKPAKDAGWFAFQVLFTL
jgi:hypothetical protein